MIPLLTIKGGVCMLRHIIKGHQRCGILQDKVVPFYCSIRAGHFYLMYRMLVNSFLNSTPTNFKLWEITDPFYPGVCVFDVSTSEARFAVKWKAFSLLFHNEKAPICQSDLSVLAVPASDNQSSSSKPAHQPHSCFLFRSNPMFPQERAVEDPQGTTTAESRNSSEKTKWRILGERKLRIVHTTDNIIWERKR